MRDIRHRHAETNGTHQRDFAKRNRRCLSTFDTHLDARRTDLHRQGQRVGREVCQENQVKEEQQVGQEEDEKDEEYQHVVKSQKESVQVESSDQRTTRRTHHESNDIEKSPEARDMGKKDADGFAEQESTPGGRTIFEQENHAVESRAKHTLGQITSRGCCKRQ